MAKSAEILIGRIAVSARALRWLVLTLSATAACSSSSDGPRERSGPANPITIDGGGGTGNLGNAPAGTGGQTAGSGGAGGSGGVAPGPNKMNTLIDECGDGNAAQLDVAAVETLKAGGNGEGRLLYPYDGTVLPRGLQAPLMMWDGIQGEAVYVHMVSSSFEYHGCLRPTAPGQLAFPQAVWDAAADQSSGPSDPFRLELTLLHGGAAKGPMQAEVTIAQATIKGSIFYNTYNTGLLGGGGIGSAGAVLRLRPGQDAEVFMGQTGCTGCHSVSANGARLVTKRSGVGGDVVALAPNSSVNPAPLRSGELLSHFIGLSPDGSIYVNTAGGGTIGPHDDFMLITNTQSALRETDTGNELAGSGVDSGAMMPTFSPNGTALVFTDLASGGHALAMQDFDPVARTASAKREIFNSAAQYPGWAFATPDSKAVVFSLGSDPTFATGMGLSTAELHILDVNSGQATVLARAMGYATPQDASAGTTYLPFGAEELKHNFYPTVSPVAAGGYFWIFFDALRHYGNLGLSRNLWGAAVRISADGSYVGDPSAPAFFLPGQELGVANHRAFAALDPCKEEGDSCETGVDCCTGFCTDGLCVPPKTCAETDEACSTDADCCNPADQCLGGYCGQVILE